MGERRQHCGAGACISAVRRLLTYTSNKKIDYADWRLAVLRWSLRAVPILFVLHAFLVVKEQKSLVTTHYYFDMGSGSGYVKVDDTLAGPKVRTDVSSILIKEDESTVFVPTVITSRLQAYKQCARDALNPGVSCGKDADCVRYYGQANATCLASSRTCAYSPYITWCNTNSTTSPLYDYKDQLTFTVIARVACNDKIFSNFNRTNPRQQYFYSMNVYEVLSQAMQSGQPIKTKGGYKEYFKSGADVVVSYNWYCDLALPLRRYDCPITQGVELLSSTAQTSRSLVTALSTSSDGHATRQMQQVTGMRFRLESRGGCYETTFSAAMGVLVKGFALESIGVILMGLVIVLWHWWYRVPRSDEMFTRASPASPGKLVSLDGPWRQRAPPPRPPSHHHPSLLRRCCWRRQEGASKVSPGGEAVEGSEGGLTPRP